MGSCRYDQGRLFRKSCGKLFKEGLDGLVILRVCQLVMVVRRKGEQELVYGCHDYSSPATSLMAANLSLQMISLIVGWLRCRALVMRGVKGGVAAYATAWMLAADSSLLVVSAKIESQGFDLPRIGNVRAESC